MKIEFRWWGIFSLILGVFFGLGFLSLVSSDINEDSNLEELALGQETTSLFASYDGKEIHCTDVEDANQCINGYRESGSSMSLLWLGNSQLHSINQMQQGDKTAIYSVHQKMLPYELYSLAFSQPNANLQEHFVLFEYLLTQLPIKTLVLSLVFDDMRESGIRASIAPAFAVDSVNERIEKYDIGIRLIEEHSNQDSVGNDMAGLRETVQEQSETWLTSRLENNWPLWEQRAALRGIIDISLYKFRNWFFSIEASSTRRVIRGRYEFNKQALIALLEEAKEKQIETILYIVPLRSDVPRPYDTGEYNSFKNQMRAISLRFDATFLDIGDLVPGQYWGTKASTAMGRTTEIDFMHFQAEGHTLLADAISAALVKQMGSEPAL